MIQPYSIPDAPTGAAEITQLAASGRRHIVNRRYAQAEDFFVRIISLAPDYSIAHYQLGRLKLIQGNFEHAVDCFERAVSIDSSMIDARRRLATVLVKLGREDESLPYWRSEISSSDGFAWAQSLVTSALQFRDLTLAGKYAEILASLRWGRGISEEPFSDRRQTPSVPLSVPKLRHDLDQFRYLQSSGLLKNELAPIISNYERVIDAMEQRGPGIRVPLGSDEHRTIAGAYNRLLHVSPSPRVQRALSATWDPEAAERQYIGNRPGIVVVDGFLSPEALEGVRKFCLESTVWFHNRYAHGRLGAFFQDGFNSPLLLQIAEELRKAFPRMIGDRYPIKQIWGFKNAQPLPDGVTTHADFAAVNVNFWITPDEANLDSSSGGLIIYDVDAPMRWDFDTYNGSDMIKPFLRQQAAGSVTIPYRQNRAIIFNSDLFHATAAVSFRPEYENHRINVTMLFGDREGDVHHRELARFDPLTSGRMTSSSAFRNLRKAIR
jgi:hypothetical protein